MSISSMTTMAASSSSEPAKPITDLSARAVSLAREIDRLPPGGYYVILLKKPTLKALDWTVDIARQEPIRKMLISKREAESEPNNQLQP